tara:strand:+ start:683 stop:1042 length:360 start_codon:yes stop_codon:yes gene_type:complete
MVFLLGGFVVCPILSALAFWKKVPRRGIVLFCGIIPPAVLAYSTYFNLLVRGRDLSELAPMLPIVIAIIGPLMSYKAIKENEQIGKLPVRLLQMLLAAQMWAILVLWLATNSGFMGANA